MALVSLDVATRRPSVDAKEARLLGGQNARVFAVTGLLCGEKGMECMPLLLLLLLQSRYRGALHCCGRVMFRRFN